MQKIAKLPILISVCIIGICLMIPPLNAQEIDDNAQKPVENASDKTEDIVRELIKKELDKRMKVTGKLDIFDEKANLVRNLSLIDFLGGVNQTEGNYVSQMDFRDFRTGDIVTVEAVVVLNDGEWMVRKLYIKEARPVKVESNSEVVKKEEYSDQEIKDFMLAYLERQAKFTGNFNAFDEDKNKLRKLTPGQFNDEIRHFGIRFIAKTECEDVESKEKINVDVTIENKEGQLSVKSVRIVE